MTEFFELMIDKSDVVDLAAAIDVGNAAAARVALDRVLAAVIDGNADILTEWLAQGRAFAAKRVAA